MPKSHHDARSLLASLVLTLVLVSGALTADSKPAPPDTGSVDVWRQVERRAEVYRECLVRANRVLQAWLPVIDAETGLVPERHEKPGKWTVANSAADLYSSLVLVATLTDRSALDGILSRALTAEQKHALRIGRLPDDLDLRTLRFVHPQPSLARSTFGAAEWCRDGLLRITERLGSDTAWGHRLEELASEVMTRAAVSTRLGPIPAGDHEVDGEMLQVLSRLHALTGDAQFLHWAVPIAEYHLIENPVGESHELRLRDHGGEIVSGLAEFFVMVWHADRKQADRFREPLRQLLDQILEVGQAPDGMLYDIVDLQNGKVLRRQIIDTWGYIYNAHLTWDIVTGEERYRPGIRRALQSLPAQYADFRWETVYPWGGSDEYADTLESALVLDNRLHVAGVEEWILHTLPRLWAFQKADGTVNRLYDDGSLARTALLVANRMAEGVRAEPWRDDLRLGAVASDGRLNVWLAADRPWEGRLVFDSPRSRLVLHLPVNYPRINEWPEWHVVTPSASYRLTVDAGPPQQHPGSKLLAGLPVRLDGSYPTKIVLAGP